ncbi:MAG TPA: hypothetical protein PKY82_15595 [Pyrinomonadaceae bacterium]|nr:hypothetical protein [Pyrinomonadaceae bacterium]
MKTIRPENAKFVAVVENVRELRLIGTANLDFWNKQLANKPYQVFDKNGFAEITISATELIWKGFRFNELTIFLSIAEKDDSKKEAGVFLLHAFNSNRLFAFCERAFFSTPYYFGNINLSENLPCVMSLENLFEAKMSAAERQINEVEDNWEGAVFLPKNRGEKYFIAKLSGETQVCLFDESDQVELKSDVNHPIFDSLIKSNFIGKEWRMRSNAFHAKSKTYSVVNS